MADLLGYDFLDQLKASGQHIPVVIGLMGNTLTIWHWDGKMCENAEVWAKAAKRGGLPEEQIAEILLTYA